MWPNKYVGWLLCFILWGPNKANQKKKNELNRPKLKLKKPITSSVGFGSYIWKTESIFRLLKSPKTETETEITPDLIKHSETQLETPIEINALLLKKQMK